MRDFGVSGRNHYAHDGNPPYYAAAPGAVDYLMLRDGAARRLARVNEFLAEGGLSLFVFDAWRPRAVQSYFHHHWAPREIKRRRPELSGAALEAEVTRYWAAPSLDAMRPAPHATGGAVDLTLTLRDGTPLFMGSVFDDPTTLAHTDRFEQLEADAALSFSAEEAQANRRVLYWAMIEAGFANHPDEWWHFSYGDQMWARLTGQKAALWRHRRSHWICADMNARRGKKQP
ncbi:MAG: M15 family metallopeptidase [Hyphomonadaceae bacterium]